MGVGSPILRNQAKAQRCYLSHQSAQSHQNRASTLPICRPPSQATALRVSRADRNKSGERDNCTGAVAIESDGIKDERSSKRVNGVKSVSIVERADRRAKRR
jgi:hypothetical protein